MLQVQLLLGIRGERVIVIVGQEVGKREKDSNVKFATSKIFELYSK